MPHVLLQMTDHNHEPCLPVSLMIVCSHIHRVCIRRSRSTPWTNSWTFQPRNATTGNIFDQRKIFERKWLLSCKEVCNSVLTRQLGERLGHLVANSQFITTWNGEGVIRRITQSLIRTIHIGNWADINTITIPLNSKMTYPTTEFPLASSAFNPIRLLNSPESLEKSSWRASLDDLGVRILSIH